jgi:UDP-2,3-diacylglucosamine pyrophosphatase LpxH
MRTIVLGDVHLGSPLCRAGQLTALLERADFDRLILNGDIFDDLNFRRLKDRHWKVVERIRALSSRREVIWIRGNHDGSASVLGHLLGVPVREEYSFLFRGEKVYVVHGDQFDDFHSRTRGLKNLRDIFYGFAIWFDVPRKAAIQWAQRSNVIFARAVAKVKRRALEKASAKGARWVVVGHTHRRESDLSGAVGFLNPSSWLTSNPAYVLFDEAEQEPRLVVMGPLRRRQLRRSVRTRVRKAGRRLSRGLSR